LIGQIQGLNTMHINYNAPDDGSIVVLTYRHVSGPDIYIAFFDLFGTADGFIAAPHLALLTSL
jgi:hypothetical protein